MSSTVLYIGNTYIHSLAELCKIIDYIIKAGNGENSVDYVYKEIETLFKDGVLQNWLEEGNQECKDIAKQLRLIPNNIDSSKLKESIGQIFTNEKIQIERDFKNFISIDKIIFVPNANEEIEVKNNIDYPSEVNLSASLKLFIKIIKQEQESFPISVLFNGAIVNETKYIDLRQFREGESVTIEFNGINIKAGLPSGKFELFVDEKSILELPYNGEFIRRYTLSGKNGSSMVSFSMMKIKGGRFKMTPEYEVKLSDFYMAQTQVTQELWMAVMSDNPSQFKEDKNPVENVSWYETCGKNSFIAKLNRILKDELPDGWSFKLPTEAQWEYAARGGQKSRGNIFPGESLSSLLKYYAWFCDNSNGTTHNVALKKTNELNIYDMSGNVMEWCWDCYGKNYPQGHFVDPEGPQKGNYRIVRGGAYNSQSSDCKISERRYKDPNTKCNSVGFRICMVKK